jgi:recombination protein RecA
MTNDDTPSNDDARAFVSAARAAAPAGSARAAAAVLSLDELRARRGGDPAAEIASPKWSRAQLAGRLVEVSALGASAVLTAAIELVLEAQVEGEPAVWISLPGASFYPPDLADRGVDLDALIVVRAPDTLAAGRAADRLLRSGAFGLVVIDLGPGGSAVELPMALQGRLVGLAQRHDAALVCITEKPAEAASLGSMVSLRAEALRIRDGGGIVGGALRWAVRAVKDKRRGPGWEQDDEAVGPAGS